MVFAGTINGRGSVLDPDDRAVADTTLERIVRLVRDAQAAKTGAQLLVESWKGPYVAGVLIASAFVFVGSWYLHREGFSDSFYHAMVMLVVASPCAVVVGCPGRDPLRYRTAARHGVLFKGGAHLEMLGKVDVIAFDKTGTITPGKPVVTSVWRLKAVDRDRPLAAGRLCRAAQRASPRRGGAGRGGSPRRGTHRASRLRDAHR